jgi:hypothetical protein
MVLRVMGNFWRDSSVEALAEIASLGRTGGGPVRDPGNDAARWKQ